MYSTDDDLSSPSYEHKRRRVTRACDSCRQRKIRCKDYENYAVPLKVYKPESFVGDEPTPPHNKCSHCFSQSLECRFTAEPKKRGRAKGYVERIEIRLRLLERLVKKLCPNPTELFGLLHPYDPEYAKELTNVSAPESPSEFVFTPAAISDTSSGVPGSINHEPESSSSLLKDIIHKVASISLGSNEDPCKEDQIDHVLLSEKSEESKRFYGNTSGAMVVQTATILKNKSSKNLSIIRNSIGNGTVDEPWKRYPWENEPVRPAANYTFPPPDLISKLTNAYFEHSNVTLPLLHKPTFLRAIQDGLHLTDEGFGGILLLVFAVGSRYTDDVDERTLSEGTHSPLSAGWKWYSQVQVVKQSSFDPPTLYDLQMYSLAVMFLSGCFAPQTVWIMTGFGIRLAQDVGAHLRRVSPDKLTVDDELWKRAFWILVAFDRMASMGIGRPCAIFDDHFDVDMPVECDDEYWEHPDPAKRFKQPEGIPTTLTGFKYLLHLFKIAAYAMSTIYTIKTKSWESVIQEYDQHIITELDSSLNNWTNSLPDYLRWDPNRANEKFLKVSGILMTILYYVRIFIHRPHVMDKGKPTPTARSSLLICNSAARSCALILKQQMEHFTVIYPHMQVGSVVSGIVLLLNMWGNKKRGLTADLITLRHVQVCMNVLRKAETRWHTAEVMLHVLNELSVSGQFLNPKEDPIAADTVTQTNVNLHSGLQTDIELSQNLSFPVLFGEQGESLNNELLSSYEASVLLGVNSTAIFDQRFSNTMYEDWDSMFGPLPSDASRLNSSIEVPYGYESSAAVDYNPMDMWLNAPGTLDINEWNSFLASFSQ